jgi:hypothetical protein
MKTIICDVCKRAVPQPEMNRNYFHIGHRELCEPCKDQLDLLLRPIIRDRQPFNYEWFDQLTMDSIEKAILRGKFEAR